MQIETKHRVLGVLVVIGLVIILLPFFQSRKELLPESTIAKAPTFPDQSVQFTEATPDSPNSVSQQPDDIISIVHPSVVNSNNIERGNKNNATEHFASQKNSKEQIIVSKSHLPTKALKNREIHTANSKKAAHDVKLQFETSLQSIGEEDGLLKLNSAAWVIQIGSFKNKKNALRLVNQLRAKGYSAFIQQVSTTLGTSTRVFVGPEVKRNIAHALASRLEKDMHLQGVVISYKPLTL